jgi:hypothetical protein
MIEGDGLMHISKKLIVFIAGLLVVTVGALGLWIWTTPVRVSLAQASSPTATPGASTKNAWTAYRDFFLNAFASHLGVSSDKVKEAYSGAYSDTLDQAVKDGKITQEQADQLKNKLANGMNQGDIPGFSEPRGGRHGFGGRGFEGGGFGFTKGLGLDSFAKALNMSVTDLSTALRSGKTIADVAKEQNVDLTQVKTHVLADLKATLDQAVTNGKLTQTQADTIYSRTESNFDNLVNQKWPERPFRGPRNPNQSPGA